MNISTYCFTLNLVSSQFYVNEHTFNYKISTAAYSKLHNQRDINSEMNVLKFSAR